MLARSLLDPEAEYVGPLATTHPASSRCPPVANVGTASGPGRTAPATATTAAAETAEAMHASRAVENTPRRKCLPISDIAAAHSEITTNDTSDHMA
jgi:hypothetical protein